MEDSTHTCYRRLGWLIATSIFIAPAAPALAGEGGVIGWVENSRGMPVAGALVSVFGKGIQGGNLITHSDSQGQFILPSLPPGSYTLRAVRSGHQPSAAQHIEVIANRDSLFTLSLVPTAEAQGRTGATSASSAEDEARRDWLWLMRHKRRSVLETETAVQSVAVSGDGAPRLSLDLPAARPTLADFGALAGNVEIAAASGGASTIEGSPLPGGLGALRLGGRLADGVRWSLGGLMAENEGRLWRTAAQFVIEPGPQHTIEAGAGFGAADTRLVLPDALGQPARSMGAVFAKDRWKPTEHFTATAGARYTYIGFLPSSNHADAVLELELQGDPHTVLRGSITTRTLTPGGDLLTLSTVAASPAITWARLEGTTRPSRTVHYSTGVQRTFGSTQVSAQIFDESTADVLLTTFSGSTPVVRNAGSLGARGFGVLVGHRVGPLNGSVAYTFGRSRRRASQPAGAVVGVDDADFHDVVARLDAIVDSTETRLSALYRFDAISDVQPGTWHRTTSPTTRFDLQLTQGLPFLQPLTRADWELLLAVRNMFYEASETAFLDELAVEEPPTRVVGGISVRF